MRKILILGLIVLVIFLAGCARKGEVPTGNGVVIQSFGPDVSTVDSNTPVNFILNIKNSGGQKAENVHAILFGLSDKWATTGNIGPAKDTSVLIVPSLAPADPSTGLPGEEATQVWTVKKAPPSSSDITYDANVRVQHTYKTEATGTVRVVNADYLRTNPNVQRGVTSSQSTAGPLVVNFFARSPVISPPDSTTVRVQIEVQNVGSGKTFSEATIDTSKSVTTVMLNKIKITVGGCTTGGEPKEVLLIGGKSATINCERSSITTSTFEDIAFTVTVEYGYFVDSATQVTVLKKLT